MSEKGKACGFGVIALTLGKDEPVSEQIHGLGCVSGRRHGELSSSSMEPRRESEGRRNAQPRRQKQRHCRASWGLITCVDSSLPDRSMRARARRTVTQPCARHNLDFPLYLYLILK